MIKEKNNLCSMTEHAELDVVSFCKDCKMYMCGKCQKYHFNLFKNHNLINFYNEKEINDIFTGLCKEKHHSNDLIYFCKTHNQLCCAQCITKIKSNENGQHTNCNVCQINDIENEKKNKLKENINWLEDLSNDIQETINKLKDLFERINKGKEILIKDIQNVFEKIINIINQREDELLLEIDNKYNALSFNIDIIKESEKIPDTIKMYIEKGNLIQNNWKENKLNFLINDCLNIENAINEIKKIHEKMLKYNSLKIGFTFYHNDNEINQFTRFIKTFGKIKKTIF